MGDYYLIGTEFMLEMIKKVLGTNSGVGYITL